MDVEFDGRMLVNASNTRHIEKKEDTMSVEKKEEKIDVTNP